MNNNSRNNFKFPRCLFSTYRDLKLFLFRWISQLSKLPTAPEAHIVCCCSADWHSLALLLCTYIALFLCQELLSVGETRCMAVALTSVHFTLSSYWRKQPLSTAHVVSSGLAASARGSAWLDGRQCWLSHAGKQFALMTKHRACWTPRLPFDKCGQLFWQRLCNVWLICGIQFEKNRMCWAGLLEKYTFTFSCRSHVFSSAALMMKWWSSPTRWRHACPFESFSGSVTYCTHAAVCTWCRLRHRLLSSLESWLLQRY